jgi:hypothetical protein
LQGRANIGRPISFDVLVELYAGARTEAWRYSRPRGSFNADIEYQALDIVLCNGSSYVALCDGRDGKDGATGPRGERGERGLIGPRGEPAATITAWRVDRASYTVTPLLSNGLEGAALELRGLFDQFVADTK